MKNKTIGIIKGKITEGRYKSKNVEVTLGKYGYDTHVKIHGKEDLLIQKLVITAKPEEPLLFEIEFYDMGG